MILNPRRAHWAADPAAFERGELFEEQVQWELDALEKADLIAMYLVPGTRSPISLLELGLYARSGKLVVSCPDGFWRKGNVEAVCRRYGVPTFGALDDLMVEIRSRVEAIELGR